MDIDMNDLYIMSLHDMYVSLYTNTHDPRKISFMGD